MNVTYLDFLDSGRPDLVTRIRAPGSRTVTLGYDPVTRHLTSITDAAGIQTTLAYNGVASALSSITTPYGTTYFSNNSDTATIRSVVITEPGGAMQAYALFEDATGQMPISFDASQLPDNTPGSDQAHTHGTLETSNRQLRNTFYWNRRQWAALGLPDPANPD